MAFFQDPTAVSQLDNIIFDEVHAPRDIVSHSGIYKCTGCDMEIAASLGEPLPHQNHHRHSAVTGPLLWRLVVWARY